MILLLSSLALADSITLDTGATIEGDLARYEFGGNCQLSVTEGDLAGVILIVPCHRVESFQRTSARRPVPIGVEVEAERQAAARAVAPTVATAPPAAPAPVAAPVAVAAPPLGEAIVDTSDVLVAEELSAAAPAGPLAEPDAPTEPTPAASAPAVPLPPLTTFGGVVDGQLQYDEPLFPEDAITPIAPEPGGAPIVEPEPQPVPVAPEVAAPPPTAATSAVDGPITPPADGPRMAPRMDEPNTRAVRF